MYNWSNTEDNFKDWYDSAVGKKNVSTRYDEIHSTYNKLLSESPNWAEAQDIFARYVC
jgi:hypothetical protein